MALPNVISGGSVTALIHNHYVGPFRDGNGNIYILFRFAFLSIGVWKSTDVFTASSFAEQDTANRPAAAVLSIETAWATTDGHTLFIAWVDRDDGSVYYSKFDMSSGSDGTDAWDIVDGGSGERDLIETPSNQAADQRLCVSIAVRNNGDPLLVFSNGDQDSVMGQAYDRFDMARGSDKVSPTWTVGIQAPATFGSSETDE